MVSLSTLAFIDQRCREIFPGRSGSDFGGLNVILVGDFCQLPPVGDRALFDTKRTQNTTYVSGQRLYKAFIKTLTLQRVMRQQGDDAEAVAFRQALDNLRHNKVRLADWNISS